MNYKELLRHPKWQEKRLLVMNKHGWMCDKCGSDDICLHVHHKEYIYGKKPWEYPDSNFEVLCEICHEGHHDKKKMVSFKEVMDK